MKIIVISLMLLVSIFANEDKKWETNKNCEACHKEISQKWETSRHANSHFSKNELFRKSLEFMQKETFSSMNELKLECARCHNPAVSKKNLKESDKFLIMLDLDFVNKKYDKILNSNKMKNGINCIVCHSIDKIHFTKEEGSEGLDMTMLGPFKGSISPYHSTKQHSLFTKDDGKLCSTCHYSSKNMYGVEVYDTGKEFQKFYSSKNLKVDGCKSCHMSEKKKGVASNYAKMGEEVKKREVRDHFFASVDNSNILKKYIKVSDKIKNNKFSIIVNNTTPHSFPSGYGLREVHIDIGFFDYKNRVIKKSFKVLTAKWIDAKGDFTIPHLAVGKYRDSRIKGRTIKEFRFKIPNATYNIFYKISFKMIGNEMAKKLGITDPFFLKDYEFIVKNVKVL